MKLMNGLCNYIAGTDSPGQRAGGGLKPNLLHRRSIMIPIPPASGPGAD